MRTDYQVKHAEYADAGISHYWIIDITEPVSLVACRGYENAAAVAGIFATDVRSRSGSTSMPCCRDLDPVEEKVSHARHRYGHSRLHPSREAIPPT